jgi:phage tail-like protein
LIALASKSSWPKVLAAQAIGPKTVLVSFSEAVVMSNPSGFTMTPLEVPAVTVLPLFVDAAGTVAQLHLDTEMTPDVRYEIRVSGITDLSGIPVLPPFDQTIFVGFRLARPQGRRFDLWSMLPKHNRREDVTGDLQKFISCLQEVNDLLLSDIDRFPDIFDLERAPESFLDDILRDLGNPFAFELEPLEKRRLASVLVEMFNQKGTAAGIRNAIRFFLGIEVVGVVPFTGTTLVLGESELGVNWELGPSDRFARYAFDVIVDRLLTDVHRKHLRAIVEYLRPAPTHFVSLIEPSPAPESDDWVLGIGTLGRSTALL